MKKLSRQNFDDLIRERFEGFEQNPPDHLTEKIKQSVHNNGSVGNNLINSIAGNKWFLSAIVLVVVSGIVGISILGFQPEETNTFVKSNELLNAIELTENIIPNNNDAIVIVENDGENKNAEIVEEKQTIIVDQDERIEIKEKELVEKNLEIKGTLIVPKSNAGKDKSVCGLECFLAAQLSNEKVFGEWSYSGPGKIYFSSDSDPEARIKATRYGTYNLTWTERYKEQQSNDVISVEFFKSGDITATSEVIDATCHNPNGSVEIYPNGGDGNYSYYWNDETAPGDSYKDNLSAGSYDVKVIDGNNCQTIVSVVVDNKGILEPAFVHKELTLSIDVPIYFINSTKVDGISYENISSVTFLWKFGDGNTSDIAEPEHTFKRPGHYEIKMYATSPEGCKDSTKSFIKIDNENVQYVNIFTPNGDGVNDVFYVNVKYLEDFNCVIVNRFGKEIYKWNNLEDGWDGKLADGSYASPGTYYYFITGKDKNKIPYNYQNFFMLSR